MSTNLNTARYIPATEKCNVNNAFPALETSNVGTHKQNPLPPSSLSHCNQQRPSITELRQQMLLTQFKKNTASG